MLKISNGYKIKESLIINFEKKFDVKLPDDYKRFMLENNGGESDDDFIFEFYDDVIKKNNRSVIRCFFRIYENKEEKVYDDLGQICENMWGNGIIDRKMLPIADDPGGNVICMSINNEDFGTIYFLNHEIEDCDTGFLFSNKICSSFSDFTNMLYIEEE